MRARPDVEYAQPRYLNHAMARPNDTLYANQWNFPAIDMERAWDIQPGASSDIIVAVLDSGMAFRDITVRYNSRFAFRLTPSGPLYPALGAVDVPFAAAPELGASGSPRFVAPRDFIWGDDLPVDLDVARHARRRHRRPAHQQRQRYRRHGLQRQADAGESDPGVVG